MKVTGPLAFGGKEQPATSGGPGTELEGESASDRLTLSPAQALLGAERWRN